MLRRNKRFLNESHHEGGSIHWHIITTKTDYAFAEGSIIIRDCDKSVEIDMYCSKRKHVADRISKVEALIEELEKVKLALIETKKCTTYLY